MPKPKPKSRPKRLEWRIKQKEASSSEPAPVPPPWVELPREITADILVRLGAVEILENAQRVCSTWWRVSHDPSIWRFIDMRRDSRDENYLNKLCRVAVDRSQGQLVKINIEHNCDDDLLSYIATRSSQLRHLRLTRFYHGLKGVFSEVVKNMPLLEELHIYLCVISDVDIEGIGRSCPRLKSFTMNDSGFKGSQYNFNDQALAIAGNMPELRHLALFGNVLSNEGLHAILGGCPHLESLDLRHCYNIDLKEGEGDLGRRCRQQILDLKCPNDSTSDYEFSAQIDDIFDSDDEYTSGLSDGVPDYDYDYGSDGVLDNYYAFGHGYVYDDMFVYDDFTNPFSGEYLDEDGFFF